LGPPQHLRNSRDDQDLSVRGSDGSFVAHHPRSRLCLLKGCERSFQPKHPMSRYCSPECAAAARRWSRICANRRYRGSEQGKARRRDQARRYRERVRTRGARLREGYQRDATEEFFFATGQAATSNSRYRGDRRSRSSAVLLVARRYGESLSGNAAGSTGIPPRPAMIPCLRTPAERSGACVRHISPIHGDR
jgi:hypothetical protein